MIWIIALVLSVLTSAALFWPRRHAQDVDLAEARTYDNEIQRLDKLLEDTPGNAALAARKTELEKRLLQSGSPAAQSGMPKQLAVAGGTAMIVIGLALYALLGSPQWTHANLPKQVQTAADDTPSLADLLVRMEEALERDPSSAEGWTYYARMLMSARRFEEAIEAYERAADLTNDDPELVAEKQRAEQYIAAQSGPTSDQIEASEQMSDADRQAMIEGMVSGLAERLYAEPDNPDGWVRLLRSRGVLGQTELAEADIEFMRDFYSDDPETAERILEDAGWSRD